MSAHRTNCYDGGVLQTDSANTPGAIIERDASGDFAAHIATLAGLVLSGSLVLTPGTTITTSATVPVGVTIQPIDSTAGVLTATLQPAATSAGQLLIFVKTDSSGNLPTLKGNGSELINASNTYTGLSAQYKIAIVFCNGTKWFAGLLA